ncbi:phosphatidylserine/phosphatidylglycerophosphate/cardiolipin synthase-like enzyme [Salibacterium salarium]|uniref:phospholipase D family protein n=1 Tax=Salibacterium salarium TaxID=284579 RepID=UPI0027812479|nr:phospholipase D family protein [Salibacterium salarium]MDQ0300087.1 phosphatidylserine/phosphatidylglycerophosphate/cardiolipin synthase-like enzyme [Salibacterium salarium]
MKAMRENLKTSRRWQVSVGLLGILFILVIVNSVYGFLKPLPDGVSYEGETHKVDEVEFLRDVTYHEDGESYQEQMIFDRMIELIDEAEDFVVLDMFLFNKQYDQSMDFPGLSEKIVDALVEKRQENENIEIIVITDRINTFYGSYSTDILTTLENHDISVLFSNMKPLRDSNPVYSGFYRTFLQWFGTEGTGWLPNPFSPDAPDVTARSYLELINFKANHRKTLITENHGMVTSGNVHDASGYHSNIGFVFEGEILEDMLETEQTVAEMSGADEALFSSLEPEPTSPEEGDYSIQLLTEGKIEKHVLQEIDQAKEGETVTLGAFYLSDRDVIESLLQASNRGVVVNVLLDANKDAFGREKNGIPNRPVAYELVSKSEGDINVRWYRTDGEQFHTKMVYIENEREDVLIGGSSNFTKRNMGDFNLETDVKIKASSETEVMNEVDQYFERLWTNEDHRYTDDYETYVDDSRFRYLLYRFQEWSGISSF